MCNSQQLSRSCDSLLNYSDKISVYRNVPAHMITQSYLEQQAIFVGLAVFQVKIENAR